MPGFVFGSRHDFQVLYTIVRFVFVLMMNVLVCGRESFAKCLDYQLMHRAPLGQSHHGIPVRTAKSNLPVAIPTNPPQIGYRIHTLPPQHRTPNFIYFVFHLLIIGILPNLAEKIFVELNYATRATPAA